MAESPMAAAAMWIEIPAPMPAWGQIQQQARQDEERKIVRAEHG
jgi:hypothetical protein